MRAYLDDAVLELLGQPPERVTFVHSAAHDLENAQNPPAWRAGLVTPWLVSASRSEELAMADVFATTDARFLALASRHAEHLHVRTTDAVTLAREVLA